MIIKSKRVWQNEQFVAACVEVKDGKIAAILPYEMEADQDYGDQYILPGFFDIHTHGWNKCDCEFPTVEAMEAWKKHMPHEGVTSFMATTATASYENNMKGMVILKDAIEHQGGGAEILGINMEGNYISFPCKGAQDPYNIAKPDAKQFTEYNEASGNHIMMVTYAPECDDADLSFIEPVLAQGTRVSIGHSAASFEKAREAVKKGATGFTHTGNGMKPFHHRTPGVFGAALNSEEAYAECIGDGQHVNFEVAHIIGTMKGKDKLILVTDSTPFKDDPAYDHMCRGGGYRLPDGTLFGSALYINKGVYNLHFEARLPLATAINAATINPAKYLGVDDRKGSLEAGKDADIVVCNETFELEQVYCKGVAQF